MDEIAGSSRSDIACLNCGHRGTRVFEIGCAGRAVHCDRCGAIVPAHSLSQQAALSRFKPHWSQPADGASDAWAVEVGRLEAEAAVLRSLVARMVDYLPRGSELQQEAMGALH